MSFILIPQEASITELFDPWCYEDRKRRYKERILEVLVRERLKAHALEYKKRFEEVPPILTNQEEIEREFGRKAEEEAIKIIEEERRLLAQKMQSHIQTTCKLAISQLDNIVWTRGKDGKAEKHKIIVEKMVIQNNKGDFEEREVQYIGNKDFLTLERIDHIQSTLNAFRFIINYCGAETQELFRKAIDLCTLERVEKK